MKSTQRDTEPSPKRFVRWVASVRRKAFEGRKRPAVIPDRKKEESRKACRIKARRSVSSIRQLRGVRNWIFGCSLALVTLGCATNEPPTRTVSTPSGDRAPIDFRVIGTGIPSEASELQELVSRCNETWAEMPTRPQVYFDLAEEFAAALRDGDYIDLTEQLELADRCIRNARAGKNFQAMVRGIRHKSFAEHSLERIHREDPETEYGALSHR